MEILPIVFSVVVIVLAIILSVVGIQFIFILMEVKRTLAKLNQTIDLAEAKINAIVQPFQNFGGLSSGLSTGFKVFETFVSWLQRNKN
jgi:hypothetical protein